MRQADVRVAIDPDELAGAFQRKSPDWQMSYEPYERWLRNALRRPCATDNP
jgi:hypothetical protein